jgi:BirA family biotin operon repressor/biotin-[acetyl-CoA-carboxylase] ligase
VLVEDAPPPRAPLLARVVAALDERAAEPTARVLADYLRRCETIGHEVHARLAPLGPGATTISGMAVTVQTDGALVVQTADDRRIAVRPQGLGLLER